MGVIGVRAVIIPCKRAFPLAWDYYSSDPNYSQLLQLLAFSLAWDYYSSDPNYLTELREIVRRIDVAQYSRIIDVDPHHDVPVRGDHRLGAVIGGKRRECRAARLTEADGMPALVAEKRRRDRCATLDRGGDLGDRFGAQPRHVGERDDPALGIARRANAAGETGAHAIGRVGAPDNARAGGSKRRGKPRIAGPDDRHDIRDRREEVTACDHADALGQGIGVQLGQQLVAAKTLAATRREQDADYRQNRV